MDKIIGEIPGLSRDKHTEHIYDGIFSEEPRDVQSAEDIIDGINRAMELDERSAFLEGVAERLTQLGTACKAKDKDIISDEVKQRYNRILGKSCPKAVQNWLKGDKT